MRFPLDTDLTICKDSHMVTKDRVRRALKRRTLTQDALAKQLGISPSYLSQILAGKRRAPLTVALAIQDSLGIPARDFAQVA